MSDEIRNAIVEEGERLPAGSGNVTAAIARGKRRLLFKRASYGALSVVVVGAGWLGATQVVGEDDPTIAVVGESPSPTPTIVETAPGRLCPNDTSEGMIIDWISFIKFDDISYHDETYSAKISLKASDLGPIYDEVQCTIADHVARSDYEIQNGDAAFLEPHTEIYEVDGYDPAFRLAARWNGDLILFQAYENPNAQVGGDLLDIRDKVDYIAVNSPIDGRKELGAIHDTDQVQRLTKMVLEAPVDQAMNLRGDDNIFVAFHLEDGSVVVKAVSPHNNVMDRGIRVPDQFVAAVAALSDED